MMNDFVWLVDAVQKDTRGKGPKATIKNDETGIQQSVLLL
jgi:hypothetical protein